MRTSDCFSFVHFFTVKKLAAHIPVINVAILYLPIIRIICPFLSVSFLRTHTHTHSRRIKLTSYQYNKSSHWNPVHVNLQAVNYTNGGRKFFP